MERELCARTIGELNGGGDGPPDECPPVLARQAKAFVGNKQLGTLFHLSYRYRHGHAGLALVACVVRLETRLNWRRRGRGSS